MVVKPVKKKSKVRQVHKEPATWLSYAGVAVLALPEILTQAWQAIPPELKADFQHTKSISIVLFGAAIIRGIIKFGGSNGNQS
ncbi:hypothetical protein [Burkholderia phage vB_BpP_HN03]|uniref:Holin n=1 Tax=Burkholderia phage vB_BpP_HN02 TaxID=3116925 RepID=A0AAX4JGZ4_9CAUD|nr:hypothetical protein [Burkholderia phage vB_BpP_HN01]